MKSRECFLGWLICLTVLFSLLSGCSKEKERESVITKDQINNAVAPDESVTEKAMSDIRQSQAAYKIDSLFMAQLQARFFIARKDSTSFKPPFTPNKDVMVNWPIDSLEFRRSDKNSVDIYALVNDTGAVQSISFVAVITEDTLRDLDGRPGLSIIDVTRSIHFYLLPYIRATFGTNINCECFSN